MARIFKTSKFVNYAVGLFLAIGLVFAIKMNANAAITAPTNLTQTNATESRIYLQWTPSNVSAGETIYYYILYGTDSTFSTYSGWGRCSSSTVADYVYQNLQAGSTYYVKVGASTTFAYSSEQPPVDTMWSSTVQMVTTPGQVQYTSIKQTGAAETSINLSWSAIAGANGYEVTYYVQGTDSKSGIKTYTTTNGINVTGLAKNTEYKFEIFAYRNNGTVKFVAYYGASFSYVPTAPTKVTGVDCTYFNMSVKKGDASFSFDKNVVADGYDYEICKYNSSNVLVKGTLNSYSYYNFNVSNSNLKTRQFYRIRVRGYVTLSDNQKAYGAWSDYDYFARIAGSDTSVKKSKGKIQASWKKVTGASSYTVYFSSDGKKYSKVITTTKTKYTINKNIKNNKYYYVRIVPNIKKSGKNCPATINSSSNYSVNVYTTKSKWYYYTY